MHFVAWQMMLALGAALGVAVRPRVTTTGGAVVGNKLPGAHEFLGIPFGKPTHRFEAPEDFQGAYVSDPLDASDFGPACLQVGNSPDEVYGSEDCLYANVWQPEHATAASNLPVMVFVNGGSNQFGESEPYNGSALAVRQGVVFVSITYRTGPIGWMAFEEDQSAGRTTGSYGLLDIQSGLRWVQREIARFGGDPARVIVHGQSSGAGLVEMNLVMPGSRGLLSGLVSQSGGLYANDLAKGINTTHTIGKLLGCHGPGLKACFQALPASNITSQTYGFGWGPHVDGVTVPQDPMDMLKKGLINPVNVILGAQTNDTFRELDKTPISATNYSEAVQHMVGSSKLKLALQLYPPSADEVQNVHSLGRLSSDQNLCSIRRRADLINSFRPGKVFMYRFNWWYQSNPSCSAEPNYHNASLGAIHEDEVTFVFGQPIFMFEGSCCGKWGAKLKKEPCNQTVECVSCWNPEFGDGYHAYFDEKEWQFSGLVSGFWAAFAATGTPNGHHSRGGQPWPVFHSGSQITQNIVLDADLPGQHKVERTLYDDPSICSFWDSLSPHVDENDAGETVVVV